MDIAALVNPVSEAPPRRSSSNPHLLSAASPASSASKLPTPPLYTHKPMQHKRKRHDPKPIWALREGEPLEPHHESLIQRQQQQQQQQQQQRQRSPQEHRQQSRPAPSTPQPRPPQPHQSLPSHAQRNGPPPSSVPTTTELQGYERPISNDPKVYDEISRSVCDFMWTMVIENNMLRQAIDESPQTQLEIEARWGQIQERLTGDRLKSWCASECVVRSGSVDTKFESTMSEGQHKRMNQYLNRQVQECQAGNRPPIKYHHTKEIDMFYDLDQQALELLPPLTRQILQNSQSRQRIRVTRDMKTNAVLKKIIKQRVANFEISSPKTEWDYRIGINLEIDFPGDVDNLTPVIERGKTLQSMERRKDRMSYSWLDAYQIDLTQVVQGDVKNHELELELSPERLLHAGDSIKRGEPTDFENLIVGMINNLRVLSREVTPAR